MLGDALSRACTRGGTDGAWGSGSRSGSMSSKSGSKPPGENGSIASSGVSARRRFFLMETIVAGIWYSGAATLLTVDLGARAAPSPERIVKTKDGFARNSFALGPSCEVPCQSL
jgi:hypothetical protein